MTASFKAVMIGGVRWYQQHTALLQVLSNVLELCH